MNELSKTYSWDMLRSDSARALKTVGNAARQLERGEYSEHRSRAQINIPSILIILPLMTSLIFTAQHYA